MKKTLLIVLCLSFLAIPQVHAQDLHSEYMALFRNSLENLLKGDYEQVVPDISRVIRRYPDFAIAYVIRARAYYEMGEFDRAIADCTLAIRYDRNNAGAYSVRAGAHVKKGDFNSAIADWRAVLRITPDNADAVTNIEQASQQRGY